MKIPVTVISGFLGSGKTTLIRHLLFNNKGKKLGVIINEFGDIGIDKELLSDAEEDRIIELTNGCICCTVADDFIPAIEKLLNVGTPPEHIIVETSGLALPKPLIKAFSWPEIKPKITVDGVIVLVDAESFHKGKFTEGTSHENPLEEVFTDQILCADMVLLNKCDLVSELELDDIFTQLNYMSRPRTKIITSTRSKISPEIILGLTAAVEDDLIYRPTHHDNEPHDHDDFESMFVDINQDISVEELEDRIIKSVVKYNILRVKGFAHIAGKPMRMAIQVVGERLEKYFDRPWKPQENRQTRMVIIAQTGIDKDAVTATLLGI